MHNIVTLRSAKVRAAKAWSLYLDEAISLFGSRTNMLIGSHIWPMWGRDRGLTGTEVAEVLESRVPPAISRAWYCRGFYGSLSHNVKCIYQRYLTWFDGEPAHLWKYSAREEGQRYVDCIGGVAALLITAYENLGFGAFSAPNPWRNFFLAGALELRIGQDFKSRVPSRSILEPSLPVEQWLNILSVEDEFRAEDEKWRLIGEKPNVKYEGDLGALQLLLNLIAA
ncbi:alkyl aryl-sulfatase [Ophiostoma piceae UAMH 11346]|uniref:Alkyl aryl-sulfatase n=1 Tax=Ophiostoma piceae (strain UAMH 11346) TaxID=1262450 RepID=S3BSQ2_OPHP1|nr:alkyl aryl-sulfatase [Ophiostoma piceae UAMH 11346]